MLPELEGITWVELHCLYIVSCFSLPQGLWLPTPFFWLWEDSFTRAQPFALTPLWKDKCRCRVLFHHLSSPHRQSYCSIAGFSFLWLWIAFYFPIVVTNIAHWTALHKSLCSHLWFVFVAKKVIHVQHKSLEKKRKSYWNKGFEGRL